MERSIENRVALVTGGSRGIGRAAALRLAKEGAGVVVNYVCNGQAAQDVLARILQMGRRGMVVRADCANTEEVESMIAQSIDTMGKLHILLNNAITHRAKVLQRLPPKHWDTVVKSGLYGTYYYCCKAALIGFTRSLAKELGTTGITVNAVTTGYFQKDMTAVLTEKNIKAMEQSIPLGRGGKPEEVAELVAFLATPGASYVTGAIY